MELKTVSVTPEEGHMLYLCSAETQIRYLVCFVGDSHPADQLAHSQCLENFDFQPDLNKLRPKVFKASSDAAAKSGSKRPVLLGYDFINIGIFNLIPIPALDGGKTLNIIEAIRRKPLKQEIETYVTSSWVVIMVVLTLPGTTSWTFFKQLEEEYETVKMLIPRFAS